MILAASTLQLADVAVMVAYFAVVVFVGVRVGKFTTTTHDFFFAGQRFVWWLVAISCVATLVGSYSFQMYSQASFKYGFAAMAPYMNEWFVLPIFLIGWLPIIYYSRVQSIPEYFERRFDRRTRIAVLVLLLLYLEVYIALNLLLIGQILYPVLGIEIFGSEVMTVTAIAAVMALLSGIYLHAGGQTSVLMTDLLQGLLLLIVGLSLVALGIHYVGSPAKFFAGLPPSHQFPLAPFNRPPGLFAVGDFWNDAAVGTFAFYCINQGVLMRFLSTKSVRDARKAMLVVVIVFMPLAAFAVAGVGLIGKSLQTYDRLEVDVPADVLAGPEDAKLAAGVDPEQARAERVHDYVAKNIFVNVARTICTVPGMFGLVISAVVAALMSTLDTYITAVSAIAVNDIWRPMRPNRPDAYYLRAARATAILSTIVGLCLTPLFHNYDSFYQALSFFTSLIIPPLAITVLLGITWRRFDAVAAFGTLVGGSLAMIASLYWPQLITPIAQGAVLDLEVQFPYPYMRGLFGLIASLAIAVGIVLVRGRPPQTIPKGLLAATLDDAVYEFKGGEPNLRAPGRTVKLSYRVDESLEDEISLPETAMRRLEAEAGDLMYVSDARWWLGGFRSVRVRAAPASRGEDVLCIAPDAALRGHLIEGRAVSVEKLL